MDINLGFESQTLWQISLLWIGSRVLICFIFVLILLGLWRWITGGTNNIFNFYSRWTARKIEERSKEIETDELRWSKEIDRRVKLLDKIKHTETDIRQELDKLHEVNWQHNVKDN